MKEQNISKTVFKYLGSTEMFQFKNIITLAGVYFMLNYLIWVFTMLYMECVDTSAFGAINITKLRYLSTKSKRIVDCVIKLSFYLKFDKKSN